MKGTLSAAALGLAALTLAAPASAQIWRGGYADSRTPYLDARRAAYDNGYREGLKEGEKESRKRDAFDYRDEKTYQHGDKGYHREYGDRERYRQTFRAGYADGYTEAYRRIGYTGRPGDLGRREGWGRNDPWTRDGRYGGYVSDVAFAHGAQDGYDKGVEDARKGRSYDVLRHSWYRSGDRHYEGRYGSKQQYADLYRQGFREGYERGFREWRRW